MRNKKGISGMGATLLALAILVLLIVILAFGINKYFGTGYTHFDKTIVMATREACKLKMNTQSPPRDDDHDGLPDYAEIKGVPCDLCLGGDDNIDSDSDAIPDACDSNPNNPWDSDSTDDKKEAANLEKECDSGGNEWNPDFNRCEIT